MVHPPAAIGKTKPVFPLWKDGDPPVGLYIHVPFCRAICTYCAFAKGEYDPGRAGMWLATLENEVRSRAATTWRGRPVVDTVFLGGGTPSTLSPDQWRRLGKLISDGFDLDPETEFTSEANPESFSPDTAGVMREVGVNRVSFGAQSMNPGELHMLGRIHGPGEIAEAVTVARRAGMPSVSLDLMYGLPGQTGKVFRNTLGAILDLTPDHLSAYCLGLEPGTTLAGAVEAGALPRPDDDRARDLYELLVETVVSRGFDQYEISSFTRSGHACRHNTRYWTRSDYLALGPSAHGLLANHTWANPAPLSKWAAAYTGEGLAPEPRVVPEPQARFEWVFLNLRLTRGFSLDHFAAVWKCPLHEVYGEVVDRLTAGGFLELVDGFLRLTPGATFLSDAVFSEFAPD